MSTLYDRLVAMVEEKEQEVGKKLIGIRTNEHGCRYLSNNLPTDKYDLCENPEFFRTLNHRGYIWAITVKADESIPDGCLELEFGEVMQ